MLSSSELTSKLSAGATVARLDLGEVEDFPLGECRVLQLGVNEVGVYRFENEVYAIRNWCPHRGAPVCLGQLRGTMLPAEPGQYVPGLEGLVLHCPWHQWEFDLRTGRTVFGTDRRRLITYRVVSEHNHLWIEVPERTMEAAEPGTSDEESH